MTGDDVELCGVGRDGRTGWVAGTYRRIDVGLAGFDASNELRTISNSIEQCDLSSSFLGWRGLVWSGLFCLFSSVHSDLFETKRICPDHPPCRRTCYVLSFCREFLYR